MSKDSLSILAAGIAFQTFFSLFPTLTAVVSLYGLVADRGMVKRQIGAMQGVLPPEAVKLLATWLQALVQGPTTRFGIGLIVSLVLAVWSMWSAAGMLMTAVNICYGEDERRGFISFNVYALALGAGLALFGGVAFALMALLPAAFALLPVSGAWLQVLGLVRWPILAGVIIIVLGIVYRYAPDRAKAKRRWISWGSVAATALWIFGSIAFTTEGRHRQQRADNEEHFWLRRPPHQLSEKARQPKRSAICGRCDRRHSQNSASPTISISRSNVQRTTGSQTTQPSWKGFPLLH